jgi:hypothetical protein
MRLVLVSLVAVSVGVAIALPASGLWTFPGGGGTGSGTSSIPSPVIASAATTTQPLFPTGTALGGVALTLANPNPYAVHVPSLALDATQGQGGFGVDAAHAGCDLTALSYATQTNGGAGWTVPAGGSLSLDVPNAVTLAVTASDACQGAAFIVYLAAP